MIVTLAAGLLAGSVYWNDQLAFGMTLPKSKTYCEATAEGAPDRGMVILMRVGAVCPVGNSVGILDHIREKKEPAIIVSSSYDVSGDFQNSREFAQAQCGKQKLRVRKISLGTVYFCREIDGAEKVLKSVIQLRREKEGYGMVNIEISLRSSRAEDASLYWNTVRSMTLKNPL